MSGCCDWITRPAADCRHRLRSVHERHAPDVEDRGPHDRLFGVVEDDASEVEVQDALELVASCRNRSSGPGTT
jgi:hypothetical protein